MKFSALILSIFCLTLLIGAAFADDSQGSIDDAIDDVITDAEPANVIDNKDVFMPARSWSDVIVNVFWNDIDDDMMDTDAASGGAITTSNSGKRSDVIPLDVAALRQGYHYLL